MFVLKISKQQETQDANPKLIKINISEYFSKIACSFLKHLALGFSSCIKCKTRLLKGYIENHSGFNLHGCGMKLAGCSNPLLFIVEKELPRW